MLMRYARHWAAGEGIVWNVGEPPVDGATDFGFLAVVAALARLGLPLEAATRVPLVAAHLATTAIIFVSLRHQGSGRWLALVASAYFAVGPGRPLVQASFGTPFFVCAVAVAWGLALAYLRDPSVGRAIALAIAMLAMSLVRPEGVLLSGLMYAAIHWHAGWARARLAIATAAVVFGTAGTAYFLWRWDYFGQPLPNPFYRKGGGFLYPSSLRDSIQNGLALLLPGLPALPLAFSSRARAHGLMTVAIPVAGFLGAWILLSNEMNVFRRFQYPVLPIFLMGVPLWTRGIAGEIFPTGFLVRGQLRRAVVAAIAVACVGVLATHHRRYASPHWRHGPYDLGRRLAAYADRDYTMAVSEAGLVPLYSGWRAIDAWGLNDRQIAREGSLTRARLEREAPAVIFFHAYFSPWVPPSSSPGAWDAMTLLLDDYARAEGYHLAALFGAASVPVYYCYVRPDLPDTAALVELIRETEFIALGTGRPSVNHAVPGSLRGAPR